MNFAQFLAWEESSRDTIDFKKIYVDMVGDLNAGLMLSEIVYWYLPNKRGESKLRVEHDGKFWIACRRYEWWERTRLSPKQSDHALAILVGIHLVEKARYKFMGEIALHIRLIEDVFLSIFADALAHPAVNPYRGEIASSPKRKNEFPQTSKSKSTKGKSHNAAKRKIGLYKKANSVSLKRRNPITETLSSIPSSLTQATTSSTSVEGIEIDPTFQKNWDACFHQLEMQLDRQSFETWLRGAVLLDVERAEGEVPTFVIGVRNSYARDMCQHRLYRNICRVLSDVSGEAHELRFEIEMTADEMQDEADGEMPLYRLLAKDAPNNPVRPLHEVNAMTLRQLFEQYIAPITDANEATVARLEAAYKADDFGFAAIKMLDMKKRGRVRDPLAYTIGILENEKAGVS